jgi:hypothetical protein
MRNLRNLLVLSLLLAATTSFAGSSTVPRLDGGDPPPMCQPSDPTCKP